MPVKSTPSKILSGIIAGFGATLPMTIVMELLHRVPVREREKLPPHEITHQFAEITHTKHLVPEERHTKLLSMFTHFGYGAAGGGVYAAFTGAAGPQGRKVHALAGALFGLGVWAISYLGWLPAAGIMPSAREHSPRRNALMILAHLVWGVTLGLMVHQLEEMETK